MTRSKKRHRRSKPTATRVLNTTPSSRPSQTKLAKDRRIYPVIRRLVVFLVGVLGLIATICGIWGPIWPTRPVFFPGFPSNASPFDVPFNVINKSIIFDLKNLSVSCKLISIRLESETDGSVVERRSGVISARGVGNIVAAQSRSYSCPVNRGVIRVENPRVARAQIAFLSEYDSPWPLMPKVRTESEVFTLSTATNPPQWTTGTPLP